MMKKVWLVLLAVVLVFGLVLSCGGGGGKKGEEEKGDGWVHDLTADGDLTLVLTGNFEYGDGYQLNFEPPELFAGDKVKQGDVYTLELSFTGSRDLLAEEGFIGMGIVDRVTNYWNPLTWPNGGDQEEIETRALMAGVTDVKLTFTALKTSPGTAPNYNSLNMQFKSPSDKAASGNSGTYNPHPLTLTVTKFIFTKIASEGGTDEPECECDGDKTECDCGEDCDCETCDEPSTDEWPTPLLTFDSFYPLGEFTSSNPGADTQRGWLFGEGGDDYAFTDNTWLLLETKGGNMYGFGGLQLTFIQDYTGEVGKLEKNLKGGWDGYNKGADEIIYWAIKLSAHTGYNTFKSADSYTLYLGSYPWATLGFLNAYLVEEDLDKISGGKIIPLADSGVTYGFIISAKDDGIDWDALFDDSFVAVSDITYTGSTNAQVGVAITLSGTVEPANATNKTIVWSSTDGTVSGTSFTPSAAGTATVTATITNGATESTPFTKDIEITVTVPAAVVADYSPDWDTLEMSGQSWAANKPAATVIEDAGSKIGYTLEWSDSGQADYDNAYALFKVTFADGVTLADYDKVTFTYQGISGDIGWKQIGLYASETKITGQLTASYRVSEQKQMNGTDSTSVSLSITKDAALDLTGNEFYCCIFENVARDKDGVYTSYSIKNVVFSKDEE